MDTVEHTDPEYHRDEIARALERILAARALPRLGTGVP
jgi:hypothetical protein